MTETSTLLTRLKGGKFEAYEKCGSEHFRWSWYFSCEYDDQVIKNTWYFTLWRLGKRARGHFSITTIKFWVILRTTPIQEVN